MSNSSMSFVLQLWLTIALLLAVLKTYLSINKIWIRKHEQVVAESVSVSAQILGVITGLPLVAVLALQGSYEGALNGGLTILVNVVFLTIGIGFWVEGNRRRGFLFNFRAALKLERNEASDLIRDVFRPADAEQVLHILHNLAMIDQEVDAREEAFIESFAQRWGIDYARIRESANAETLSQSACFARLRGSVEEYIHMVPPKEQARQLGDMLVSLANIDEQITSEEELIMAELNGLLNDYVGGEVRSGFHVYIAPQNPAQHDVIVERFTDFTIENRLGGEVFLVGRCHSRAYARQLCDWYRESGFLTFIDDSEAISSAARANEPVPA